MRQIVLDAVGRFDPTSTNVRTGRRSAGEIADYQMRSTQERWIDPGM
jgi:hypothetical protein